MNRKIRPLFQWTLVVTLTTLLSLSPVSAGWRLHHKHCRQHAAYYYVSPTPCLSHHVPICPPPRCYPAPIDHCGVTRFATPPIDDCCICGCGAAVGSAPMMQNPNYAAPMAVEPMVDGYGDDSVIESAPIEQPFDSGTIESPSDNNAVVPVPEPPSEIVDPTLSESGPSDVPAPEPEEAPQPTPEPAEILEPPADVAPETDVAPATEVKPSEETPEESPFAVPPTDPPATDLPAADAPLEDLFGEPTAPDAPAEGEAPSEDKAPAEETAPAEQGSIDDLFGDDASTDAPTESLTDVPAEPAVEAALEAPPEPASDGLDDIFGGDAETEATDTEPADDEETPEADSETEPTDKSIDDLFGATPATATDLIESVDQLPAPIIAASNIASVTVVAVETPHADPLSSTHVRTWIDDSGLFSTKGRLIEINRTSVRLLKPNGRTCTVPHSRLSEADAAYVDSIGKQRQEAPLVALMSRS